MAVSACVVPAAVRVRVPGSVSADPEHTSFG